MNLSFTDLLALVIVGLAAWKVMRVARARLGLFARAGCDPRSDAGSAGADERCTGCRQCPGRASRR